jgi:hypothetical protein
MELGNYKYGGRELIFIKRLRGIAKIKLWGEIWGKKIKEK